MNFSQIINPLHSSFHYYGWGHIIDQFKQTVDLNNDGLILDTFVDSFFWSNKQAIEQPWVGIVHSAIKQQPARTSGFCLDQLIEHDQFKKSLPFCQGLITLTNHTKNYLQSKLDMPIYNTWHPKYQNNCFFDIDSYFASPTLRHSGFELRDVTKFYQVNTSLTKQLYVGQQHNLNLIVDELKHHDLQLSDGNVWVVGKFLDNQEYIDIFTSTIGFAYYYDCAASNAILEHIMSYSPVVINKIPAIVEYLGEDYPMYYENINHNLDTYLKDKYFIQATSDYLKQRSQKKEFTIEYFCESVNEL